MPFLIRPSRHFPLQCRDTDATDLFPRQGTVAWRIPRPCDPSIYRHGCDPPNSTQSLVGSRLSVLLRNRRFCQYVLPTCSPYIIAAEWSRSYPIPGKTPSKARSRCINGNSICAVPLRLEEVATVSASRRFTLSSQLTGPWAIGCTSRLLSLRIEHVDVLVRSTSCLPSSKGRFHDGQS